MLHLRWTVHAFCQTEVTAIEIGGRKGGCLRVPSPSCGDVANLRETQWITKKNTI
jgi:hypothetical protein